MASIGLFIVGAKVGAAVGGSGAVALGLTAAQIGGAVGGLLGGVLDQMLIMPALFGRETGIEGPRLDSKQLDTFSEGAEMHRVLGNRNRVGGTTIFVSDLIEIEEQEEQGGKGGGGAVITGFKYYVDVAFAVCQGPVHAITDVFADEKKIAVINPPTELQGEFEVSVNPVIVFPDLQNFETPEPDEFVYHIVSMELELVFPSQEKLDQIDVGRPVVTSGFSNDLNNRSTVFGSKKTGPPRLVRKKTFGTYFFNQFGFIVPGPGVLTVTSPVQLTNQEAAELAAEEAGFAVAETANPVTVTQHNFVVDKSFFLNDDPTVPPVAVHLGDDEQEVDEYLNSISPIEQPAYRGTAWVGLWGLALEHSGNRLPTITFRVRENGDSFAETAQHYISRILEDHGFDESEYDLSALPEQAIIRGYTITGTNSAISKLEPIILVHDLLVHVAGGAIVFRNRNNLKTINVREKDLATHESQSDSADPIRFSDAPEHAMPLEVNVEYIDQSIEFQTGSQSFRVPHSDLIDHPGGPVRRVHDLRLPMVISSSQAQTIARRLAYEPRRQRQKARLALPPRYIDVEPNDHLQIENGATIRVTKLDRGANMQHEIEGVVEDAVALEFASVADDPAVPDLPDVYIPPFMTLLLIESAPLLDAHVNTPGYYFAAASNQPDDTFIGATVLRSSDNVEYAAAHTITNQATLGEALTVLSPQHSGWSAGWDRHNTVDVLLYHGTLQSRTEQQVLNGSNRMYIGNELIAFRDAELIAPHTYRLSNLLRGLRGTERFVDHEPSDGATLDQEPVVLLSNTSMGFGEIPTGQIGAERFYKPVANGMDIEDVDPVVHKYEAATMRPLSPVHIRGFRAVDESLAIEWLRRTRGLDRVFQPGGVSMHESQEKYEIDVFEPGEQDVLRTIAVEDQTQATYTASQQAADGFTPGDPIEVRVHMVGNTVGRSRPAVKVL